MLLIDRIAAESPNLWILLANAQEKLPCHREVLMMHCSCVKGLPPGDTWDVSALIIDGKPVKKAVAIAWLQVVYLAGDDEKQQEAVNLADLLAFADAVGSTRGVMKACMNSLCGSLTITVSLKQFQERQQQLLQQQNAAQHQQQEQHAHPPHQWENDSDNESVDAMFAGLAVAADGGVDVLIVGGGAAAVAAPAAPTLAPPKLTFDVDSGRAYYFQENQLRSDNISSVVCIADMDRDTFSEAGRQLAAQVEVLLYQAYNLQLLDLIQRLHRFIFASSLYGVGILPRQLLDSVVFSKRVLRALGIAAGPMQQQLKCAWIDSLLLVPFGTCGDKRLVELHDPTGYDAAMPKMEGVLTQQFLGTPAGTWLTFQPQLSRISFVGNASTTPGVPGVMPLRLVLMCDGHSAVAGNYQQLSMAPELHAAGGMLLPPGLQLGQQIAM